MNEKEWADVEASVLGGPASPGEERVAAIDRDIRRTLDTLENLYKSRRSVLASIVSRRPSDEVCARLAADCPWLSVVVNSAGLPGTSKGFSVKVGHAPFFVFNEDGKALGSTLPANDMRIDVDGSGVVCLRIHDAGWRAISDVLTDDSLADDVDDDKFWGHPHCSENQCGLEPLTTDVGSMCFGGDGRRALASSINTQASLVLAVRGLYLWLTELNADSMYHPQVSGVALNRRQLDRVRGACREARRTLLEVVRGPVYAEFAARASEGDFGAVQAAAREVRAALCSDPFVGTAVARQADALCALAGGTALPDVWGVAMHQLVGAVLALGAETRGRGGECLEDAASGVLACAFTAWEHPSAHAPLMRSNFGRAALAKKFFADLEVMKSGDYR